MMMTEGLSLSWLKLDTLEKLRRRRIAMLRLNIQIYTKYQVTRLRGSSGSEFNTNRNMNP